MVTIITNAVKICEYFNVPVEYLLYVKKILTDFDDWELLKLFREIEEFEEFDEEYIEEVGKGDLFFF